MLDDFLVRATLAGVGIALVAGPLGCFVVWRRAAYFGDTIAHSALLGVGLGLLAGSDPTVGVIGVTLAVAAALLVLRRIGALASDTLLGILSHTTLALGLVVVSLLTWVRVDLFSYLFGDVLAVSRSDIALIWVGGAVVLAGLAALRRPLLAATVNEDLARAEGMAVDRAEIGFTLLLALVIAVAMKVVGILLVTALLIIPAATARAVGGTPERMAAAAAAIGAVAVVGGLQAALTFDTPAGPSIVAAAAALFAMSLVAYAVGAANVTKRLPR